MAHFAEINPEGVVLRVLVVPNNEEHRGQEYLAEQLNMGGTWVQTSYNTRGGQHLLGGTPLRKNYAGIGYKYDSQRDAFISPKPFNSWVLNETTCLWEAPVPMPEATEDPITKRLIMYTWNEETVSWVELT